MANKQKTHKGAKKRFKVSASGKVKYKSSFAGHLMSSKSGDRKRKLRQPCTLNATDGKKIITALGA